MRNLKKVLALVLALVMAMSLMVTAGATSLGDYKDSASVSPEYATAVDVATQLGILEGVGNNTYAPQGNLTRAQLATITYRIATGDVTDVYTDDFAGGAAASFTDTPADAWYAGYVGYAADAGYLKGVGEGLYKPNSTLTGYQTLAALLRVIGYNQPGQFTGPDWTVQVAQIATETGILEGLVGVDLNGPITREATALLIYNALFSDIVSYTPAFGYQNDKKADDLATDIFGIVTDKAGVIESIDDWGRPGTVWKNSDGEQVVIIAAEPVNTHVVATSQCEIATDLGLEKTADVSTYTNGISSTLSINPIVTTAIKGSAQGTLVEVYQIGDFNRLVIIDTYLALVTGINEATYDAAGHLKTAANSDITVYGLKGITSDKIDSTDYAEGTYILVNYNQATKEFEDVQAADSFVGAQTKITDSDPVVRTIDSKDYSQAVHYDLNDAGQHEIRFTWFQDQYGNIIGSKKIENTGYAVLKDIIWIQGTPGYAKATLVYMDGTETTVTVNAFDGYNFANEAENWASSLNDTEPVLVNSGYNGTNPFGSVSSDSKFNSNYLGYALYRVDTLDDGTVNLQGIGPNGKEIVDHVRNANVDVGSSVILNGTKIVAYVDDNTQFLVKEGDTYTAYDRWEIAEYAWNGEIFFTADVNNIATRVYIKNAVEEAERGDHLFVPTDAVSKKYTKGDDLYELNVVVDGVEREILGDQFTIEYLKANVGKLFHIDWINNPYSDFYGLVSRVYLINEQTDEKSDNCNYLSAGATYQNNTIIDKDSGNAYTINGSTKIVGNDGKIDTSKGIWVVWNTDSNGAKVASVVYVGTKLDTSLKLTVDSKNGEVDYTTNTDGKITVTSKEGILTDELTYTVNDENATLQIGTASPVFYTATETVGIDPSVPSGDLSRTIIVSNEAGTAQQTYTIDLVWTPISKLVGAVDYIRNGADTAELAKDVDAYFNIQDAVANAIALQNDNHYLYAKLHLDSKLVNDSSDIKVVRFTDSTQATKAGFDAATGVKLTTASGVSGDITINDLVSTTIVVAQLNDATTNVPVYVAFSVNN